VNLKPVCTDEFIEKVLEEYSNMVYRLALSQTKNTADAQDVYQEVFLRLISTGKAFESDEHLKAWLIRVTINCSRKLFSAAWFRHTVPLEEDVSFEMKENGEIYYAVMNLPLKYRTVIHLYYYEGYTLEEIAKILLKKPATVRSQLARARNLLKSNIGGTYYAEQL
jgi:RNA polymerase sigma-70 factor (ECF subfamily)